MNESVEICEWRILNSQSLQLIQKIWKNEPKSSFKKFKKGVKKKLSEKEWREETRENVNNFSPFLSMFELGRVEKTEVKIFWSSINYSKFGSVWKITQNRKNGRKKSSEWRKEEGKERK